MDSDDEKAWALVAGFESTSDVLQVIADASLDVTGLANAIDHILKRWPALTRYVDSGHLPIDNNVAENAIRPITLGRKNWLFTWSERAGCRAAAIQSLRVTAKLNSLESYAWLKDTPEKLPTWPYSRIDEPLPLRAASAE